MIKKLSLTVLTAVFLLAVTATSAEAAVKIDGNGSWSRNKVKVETKFRNYRVQENWAHFKNDADVENKTGGNEAKNNTNGDVEVKTGKTDTLITVENTANSNIDEGDDCGCPTGDVDVTISDNGSGSKNKVVLTTTVKNTHVQTNSAHIYNDVDVENKTGGNEANGNTGGSVTVTSGEVKTAVHITNEANSNVIN